MTEIRSVSKKVDASSWDSQILRQPKSCCKNSPFISCLYLIFLDIYNLIGVDNLSIISGKTFVFSVGLGMEKGIELILYKIKPNTILSKMLIFFCATKNS